MPDIPLDDFNLDCFPTPPEPLVTDLRDVLSLWDPQDEDAPPFSEIVAIVSDFVHWNPPGTPPGVYAELERCVEHFFNGLDAIEPYLMAQDLGRKHGVIN